MLAGCLGVVLWGWEVDGWGTNYLMIDSHCHLASERFAGDVDDVIARARAAGRGLWADPAYAILDASDPESFSGRVGEVVIAQGLVASFGASRGRTYLNLGPGGRGSASLSLSRAQARAFERIGQTPAALVGRTIRARGLLDMRPGPRIQITGPESVELVDGILASHRRPR